MLNKFIIMVAAAFSLYGCGNGIPTTATGIFKDATTGGLTYVSGNESGVTAADGSFTYEVGNTVTFTIGAITVGTAAGSPVVTPVDLVTDGTTSHVAVKNIVRVLNLLDSDGDSENGITISSAMQAEASSWDRLELSTVTTIQDLSSLQTLADAVSGEPAHTLISEYDAKIHLEKTLTCAYAGAFVGTWAANVTSDAGYLGFLVDAATHNVKGSAVITSAQGLNQGTLDFLTNEQKTWQLSGTTPLGFGQKPSFVSGTAAGPTTSFFKDKLTTYSGTYSSANSVSGTYTLSSRSAGTFTGSRVGGSSTAKYRVTGAYSGVDTGLFAIDIDASDNVTGIGVSTTTGLSFNVSGTYNPDDSVISGTTSSGGSFTGEYDRATGLISAATWKVDKNGVDSGTISGSGCKLN